jgi:hypothetical protein
MPDKTAGGHAQKPTPKHFAGPHPYRAQQCTHKIFPNLIPCYERMPFVLLCTPPASAVSSAWCAVQDDKYIDWVRQEVKPLKYDVEERVMVNKRYGVPDEDPSGPMVVLMTQASPERYASQSCHQAAPSPRDTSTVRFVRAGGRATASAGCRSSGAC